MNGLKCVLLNSIDNFDDIMQAVAARNMQSVTKRQFKDIVRETVGEVTEPEMDFLYKVFVQDKILTSSMVNGMSGKYSFKAGDSWKEFTDYKESKDDLL
eukprot:TRINITY_DN3137_c1_g1_i2.p3 TRINITY_DN3137_c1_g1~~TRINITY_DN3137_c1_g1_i2.p3  ORF type:complete len:114 (+),score=18.03 TRINITY_DN3137_c1_g1_i2:46-342(+)